MNLKLIYNTSRKLHQYRKVKKIRATDKKKTPAEKNLHRSLSRKFTEPLQYANRYECFCLK